jgi:uncharacterized membrane protein YedE/YeeE
MPPSRLQGIFSMSHFTPYSALAGGVLIGLAATLLMWMNGRIAGISGIAGGLLARPAPDNAWRWLFIAGLVAGAAAYGALVPSAVIGRPGSSLTLTAIAGLLVGFGTALGGGCTSGHGVCGLSRLSPRSLVATLAFMAAGFVTVYVMRHLLGGAA